ncbi:hypothetical protein [Kitasatospora sp. CB01950]|uniref:hypothetical protein n=1 Tax=Kitasatospora sp. CB01950 TaxID=1703930 RepID=UPI00093B8692
MGVALVIVLLLAVGGCGCVVWAERSGPAWVRGVSRATLAVGEMVRRDARRRRAEDRRRISNTASGDSD